MRTKVGKQIKIDLKWQKRSRSSECNDVDLLLSVSKNTTCLRWKQFNFLFPTFLSKEVTKLIRNFWPDEEFNLHIWIHYLHVWYECINVFQFVLDYVYLHLYLFFNTQPVQSVEFITAHLPCYQGIKVRRNVPEIHIHHIPIFIRYRYYTTLLLLGINCLGKAWSWLIILKANDHVLQFESR